MAEATWFEVAAAAVPASDDWLSAREKQVMSTYSFPRRCADWRAGRWAAKQAVLTAFPPGAGVRLAELEILAAADGAPEAWLKGCLAGVAVSISHREGLAAALVTGKAWIPGCDLELIEPRSGTFTADWFTAGEIAALEHSPDTNRDALVTLIWSAKESVLKALRKGLKADTREVEITAAGLCDAGMGWRPFASCAEGKRMTGWWRREGRWIMTAVTYPAGGPPTVLEQAGHIEEKMRCK
jgi:4'-phosphopantetheinyl transferase